MFGELKRSVGFTNPLSLYSNCSAQYNNTVKKIVDIYPTLHSHVGHPVGILGTPDCPAGHTQQTAAGTLRSCV